jgi:hypothetical protein
MAEHEPCIGQSDDWYTPPEIFEALGLTFDLDPCSPGPGHWVPARDIYTKADDGLKQPWCGLVFMNPPFGGRFGHIPWLTKFFDHGNGIAIVRAYTSSSWWHEHMYRAEMICFPRGKTKFIKPDGSIGKSPGHGVVFIAMGKAARYALSPAGLGMIWDRTIETSCPTCNGTGVTYVDHNPDWCESCGGPGTADPPAKTGECWKCKKLARVSCIENIGWLCAVCEGKGK